MDVGEISKQIATLENAVCSQKTKSTIFNSISQVVILHKFLEYFSMNFIIMTINESLHFDKLPKEVSFIL